MFYTVIIIYNRTNAKEHAFIQQLVTHLENKHIGVIADDPSLSELNMQRQLLTAQWLVLMLTSEAIKSSKVQSLVNTAFEHVKQGHMQGVLALTFSPKLVEPDEMPHPLWSTIRIYYVGETHEERQQAFRKLSCTLGYTRVTAQAASNPVGNRNNASSISYGYSTASRSLPAIPQRVQNSQSRLFKNTLVILALIVVLLVGYIGVSLFLANNHTLTAFGNIGENATATAPLQQPAQTPQEKIFNSITTKPSDTQYPMQEWDHNSQCAFTNDRYQISTIMPSQDTRCVESKAKLMYFAYQAQMTIQSSGDSGGLIFRSNGLDSFYRFSLDSSGYYTLIECKQSSCPNSPTDEKNLSANTTLLFGSIHDGSLVQKPITLTVIATSQTIYLYISFKSQPATAQTDTFTIKQGGEIGLFAFSQNPPTKVTFSNVKVWNLTAKGQLP